MRSCDRYRAIDVPVRGGDMRVGIWEPGPDAADAAGTPTAVLVHGVTASHRAWVSVAGRLTGMRVVAPDLRGRGRSRHLPGPYGIVGHADDIVAVMDHLQVPDATTVGHSTGGFIAVALHGKYPDRSSSVVLVDGGLPLLVPPGLSPDEAASQILGPAKERLSMTFPDRESYRGFFRAHPAFADWNDAITDYVDYDLAGEPPRLHPSTIFEAMAQDFADQQDGGDWLLPGLAALSDPTPFLRAPRDLLNREPGLWPPDWVALWQQRFPAVDVREVVGTNHYTLLFSRIGVDAVVQAIRAVQC